MLRGALATFDDQSAGLFSTTQRVVSFSTSYNSTIRFCAAKIHVKCCEYVYREYKWD